VPPRPPHVYADPTLEPGQKARPTCGSSEDPFATAGSMKMPYSAAQFLRLRIRGESDRVALGVGRKIKCSAVDKGPIEETGCARRGCTNWSRKHRDRKLAQHQIEAVDFVRARQLIDVVRDRFNFSTEMKDWEMLEPRCVILGGGASGACCFAIGKIRDPDAAAQAVALRDLGN